jgi:hypothetical protein
LAYALPASLTPDLEGIVKVNQWGVNADTGKIASWGNTVEQEKQKLASANTSNYSPEDLDNISAFLKAAESQQAPPPGTYTISVHVPGEPGGEVQPFLQTEVKFKIP